MAASGDLLLPRPVIPVASVVLLPKPLPQGRDSSRPPCRPLSLRAALAPTGAKARVAISVSVLRSPPVRQEPWPPLATCSCHSLPLPCALHRPVAWACAPPAHLPRASASGNPRSPRRGDSRGEVARSPTATAMAAEGLATGASVLARLWRVHLRLSTVPPWPLPCRRAVGQFPPQRARHVWRNEHRGVVADAVLSSMNRWGLTQSVLG